MNISFLSELSTGIVILDDSLEIIFINASALSILDTTEKNSIGNTIDQIFYEEPESINDFVGALELNRNFTKTDTVLNLKKGKKVFCTYLVHSIENNNEKGLMLEIIDKESSSELIERYRMKTNLQISQDFVRGLAHEIKNPLSGIKGSAQLLMNKVDNPENQEFLNIILKETDRIAKIIDQVSKKNFQLNPKPFNVHSILEKIPNFVDSLNLAEISVERDYDPSIPLLNVDDNLLGQVFYNLARNSVEAIDASKKGNKLILRTRIMYETFLNKSYYKSACLIEISDNGPGIPDDLIDSIFFPLVSTKEITSGLGLAIARGIINQHKGEIDCVSNSKGTTFSVILPIEDNSRFLKEELNA